MPGNFYAGGPGLLTALAVIANAGPQIIYHNNTQKSMFVTLTCLCGYGIGGPGTRKRAVTHRVLPGGSLTTADCGCGNEPASFDAISVETTGD